MRRITIRDVAQRAGVSKATVSHVINETRFVEEHTRRQVLQAIDELNYRPSRLARSLSTRQTFTVGLLISDIGNPFYHEVILAVEDVALAHDYSVFLFNTNFDAERSMKYIRSMLDRHVDGVIFMTNRLDVDLVAELSRHRVPAVTLDLEEMQMPGVRNIRLEFEIGIREAVDYLIQLGHRRFAHVTGPLDLWTSELRRNAFLGALGQHGIDSSEVTVIEGNFQIDGGRRALHQLLETSNRPTAIFAANDLTALGILWEARKYSLQIPEDLSVVGLDDISLAGQITPPLTTVALPGYSIGSLAMQMLIELINSGEEPGIQSWNQQRLTTSLVIRESTAAAPPI
ncbi:MAG: LacI family DNA-binding transcriptional regulator [Anaerolineae bacterium]|nr:LacI family DNA-binding transcriptional regulator [Anaerolineae bacterium]